MEPKANKGKSRLIKAAILFLVVAAVVYAGLSVFFFSHFLPATTLNGISISGKSQKDVEEMIVKEIDGYEMAICERDGEEEIIKGKDIALKPEFGDNILKKIKEQNAFSWPLAFFNPQKLQEDTMVVFDKVKLQEAANGLQCMQEENQVSPKDAYCSQYHADGYKIVPEEQGSRIKKKRLLSVLEEGVSNLKKEVSLEEEACYETPSITSEDEGLIKLADTLNAYTGVTLTYDVGEKQETLDGSITHAWMLIDGMDVSIDEEAVGAYVDKLAADYNTAFRKHTLKTSYDKEVEIVNGDYGWKIDKEGEKEQIIKDLKGGKSLTREITYSQRAKSHGENDYGDTYVEINLTAQHLFFYKDGSLIVESDFVSGNLSKNYDTPTGIYGLTYKERDAVLRGENYASPVTYWMPYCNNVGMHDASWRSSFGGNIYKTSGSHGCINLPKSAAEKIFEHIQEGDPVLVYTLPGTESPAAVAQEAAHVVSLINAIGEVTFESETAIQTARKLYDLLTPAGRSQVTNYDLLTASEAQLAALKELLAASGQTVPPQ